MLLFNGVRYHVDNNVIILFNTLIKFQDITIIKMWLKVRYIWNDTQVSFYCDETRIKNRS